MGSCRREKSGPRTILGPVRAGLLAIEEPHPSTDITPQTTGRVATHDRSPTGEERVRRDSD